MVLTFTPHVFPVKSIIRKLQPILLADNRLKNIFPEPPICAFRQPRNVGQQIVRSKLPILDSGECVGTAPCGKSRCKLCPHINTDKSIETFNNHKTKVRGSFSCDTSNVIYAVTCEQCPSVTYVGQTGRSIRERANEHKTDIRLRRVGKLVAAHFCGANHGLQDLRIP